MVVERRRNVSLNIEIPSLAKSGTQSCGIIECNNIRIASITAKVTYNGSATAGATLKLYYSPDGEHYDSVVYTSFEINLTAGSTVQETHILDLPEQGYIKVEITNGDSTYTVTAIKIFSTIARHGDQFMEADKVINRLEEIHKKQLLAIQKLVPRRI